MFPWLDLALAGLILWGAAAGYWGGVKPALVRLFFLVAGLLAALPFVRNAAAHLRPGLEPILEAGINKLSLPAAANSHYYFGPWWEILALEVTQGERMATFLRLATNLAALTLLMAAAYLPAALLAKTRKPAASFSGLAIGLIVGLAVALLFLALGPVLILGKAGDVLAPATADSLLAGLLSPLVQTLVHFMAFFVL